jgi:PhnB protein
MTDPFDALAVPPDSRAPRPSFARALRARLLAELDIDPTGAAPTIDLPGRKPMPSTATPVATAVIPYLTANDAVGALAWYTQAFGAEEQVRVVGPDGLLGHAEFRIGAATFYLSDEHPAMGVVSPTSLGGTPFGLHLTVGDVDALFARAVAAGATVQREPEDQPHGARHGTLLDPYGHRWMLSQPIEDVSLDEYAARSEGSGYRVEVAGGGGGIRRGGEPYVDGIWTSVTYADPAAGIRFVTEVLGFEELVLVTEDGDPSAIVHSEYRWPEGGIVQVASWAEGNEFIPRPGDQGLYVVTADPHAVWERCRAAGVEVIREPTEPHYDPGGMGFSIRDPEGNVWSFGSYAGGATE